MATLTKIADAEYEIIDQGDELFHHIVLKGPSPFSSVRFQFGSVKFIEEDNQLRIKYEYEVFHNPLNHDTNSVEFRDYAGSILMTNLEELLIYNNYKRGTKKD